MKTQQTMTRPGTLLGVVLAVLAGSAQAFSGGQHWLEVHVFDKQTGKAVDAAAVCLGTTARPDQFGALRTDANGVVRFEELGQMPVAMLATVSRTGYQGRKQLLEPLRQSRIVEMRIVSGGGGPVCHAAAAGAADTSSGLDIERVSVRSDRATPGQVLVSVAVSGTANQIRISERADFSGAEWRDLQPAVPFVLSPGKGLKQIHVQVRRYAKVDGATIEVVSKPTMSAYRAR